MSNLSAEDVAQARRDLEQSLHGVSPLPKGGIAYDPTTAHIAVAWCIRYGDALLQLAEAVMRAPVTPITEQVSYPLHGAVPLDWNEPCFKTTYARVLRCDKDGRLVPDGGEEA
jgi:hypothetical protein